MAWSYANKFYRTSPDAILALAKKEKQEGREKLTGDGAIKLRATPQRTVKLDVQAPKFYGYGTVALKNVRILTMHGDEVIEHGTIVISDGRFKAVGPTSKVEIPSSAKVYDLTGTTVMPGLK